MKQELESAIAWGVQSLNQCNALVPTSPLEIDAGSESQLMSSAHVSENPSCRVVKGSVVNGYIVYTRTKKSRHLCNGSSENGLLKRLKSSGDREANADLPAVDGGGGVEVNKVENKFESEVICNLEKRVKRNALKSEPAQFLAGEGGSNEVPVEIFNGSDVRKML